MMMHAMNKANTSRTIRFVIAVFAIWLLTAALPSGTPEQSAFASEEPAASTAGTPTQQQDVLPEGLVGNGMDGVSTDAVESFWKKLKDEYGGYFPDQQMPSFMEMIMPGGQGLKLETVIKGLLSYFLHEILYNGKLLVTIVMLTVFSMVLETLQNAFERNAVSKVAYSIAYMVLVILAVNSFHVAIGYAKDAIGGMIQFMLAMIPLLLTLLASMGNVVTVSVLHPLIIFMIHAVGTLIYTVVFPLLFFSAVLHIVSALTEKFKVTQLANLLRNVGVGVMGVLVTVFLGVISVQGATSAVTDGITMRTAKFVTGNFVPVVGRMFSDAADTVISASMLAKNAIGIAGVIILLFLCAFPAIKILTLALIYNVAAAVMQPLGDSPIVECLQTIGKTMIYVFAALAAVSLMFFLAVTIVLTAGNAAIMAR
ncbi:stage III sporulation protein AE [Paenibacillus radicis (ex Gao et al. 2016)]|uniref:Stage III sporulation protein AE n=2 Tax=Paenibacillus radicis (ex Gao et al. 2016) TaxID=1737354 RepID=A0A917GUI0_9BACL|nr:stage III sporulation protein AE [Paenibacillus radicis (ex Gao et al. 2016)]GGG56749.1 stage III sporulation protein AE [Paenibacillus radicis (ex Gao et al. 2016)]